ncbi:unnamed protein product [Trifolium pratense]|uniref:Uncharacterized protein n=1 Tax=Trifolium pratense TaxID=57577 RepID=A0ACB0L7E1_TRIPR|nr:unnamed protein product [Trifolium pratense]
MVLNYFVFGYIFAFIILYLFFSGQARARTGKLAQKKGQKEGGVMTAKVVEQQADTVKDSKVLMRSYRSKSDDATCAHNGIMATIINDLSGSFRSFRKEQDRDLFNHGKELFDQNYDWIREDKERLMLDHGKERCAGGALDDGCSKEKVNDGSSKEQVNESVLGTASSEVMFAATKKTEFVAEAVVAEALGLCWGLQIARDLNLGNIIFEMDASLVMDCFKDLLSLSSIDHFIVDCKELFLV